MQSSHTVRGGGSSIALSSRLEVRSTIRSASSIKITRHFPPAGACCARETREAISSILMIRRSVVTTFTSGWVPLSTRRHSPHCPHPGVWGSSHCKAAAKAKAATERPAPGGPVSSQACDICLVKAASSPWPSCACRRERAECAAVSKIFTAAFCPTI